MWINKKLLYAIAFGIVCFLYATEPVTSGTDLQNLRTQDLIDQLTPVTTSKIFQPSSDLKRLADYMTGYFSSEAQALADTDYFDVRLRMQRIWQNRTDGYWLYVEQAVAGFEAKPYRQRVYRVSQIDTDLFESRIYKLNEPLRFAGAWKDKNPLANLTPESLEYKPGTIIILMSKPDSSFVGSTIGKECPSDLRGAVYASTQVLIKEQGLDTWDRGYDQNDEQVWGPEKRGYLFKKIEDFPLE